MTKSKSPASSIVVTQIFLMHLMNGAQFLKATLAERLRPITVILPITKI